MAKHYKEKKKNKENKKVLILSIVRLICCITLIISISYIINWYVDNKQNAIIENKVSQLIHIENIQDVENNNETKTKYIVDFKSLKEINSDTIGWIKVSGTNIEDTVVKYKDNDYYLKHNFEKKYNKAGWIFTDYRNKLDGTDKNIIIYGHNMRNNSMFGTLRNVLKKEWYDNEENHIINFITENENYEYQVFSVYQIESEDYYIKTEFKNNEFLEFINKLKNRSVKDFNVELTQEDSILTLSTCGDNNKYRIVLHAKKIYRGDSNE